MGTIIIGLIILGIGILIGYRIGVYFIRQENQVISMQNTLLQQYSNQWASAARNTQQLTADIAQQQTTNVTATMQVVIQLLQGIQVGQQPGQLDQRENDTIGELLAKAKSIGSLHE